MYSYLFIVVINYLKQFEKESKAKMNSFILEKIYGVKI